ncbi:DUF2178 domain-containing protein [Metabacillus malikii]|uniref:Xanthine/uracil permease n=1 Tax=Metabacillus malikii TaxID=1504265 RepID=A0ABT9ZN85_9BACI|nr:DUF2178 domain-containing protein [Metabacillus malikii]MDQ0233272.1 xanthine/uracil permease [Metabacillus malikii]
MINFSDISNAMFNPIKSWAEQSQGNWNILIVSGFILVFVGAILTYVIQKKMGEADERTNQIKLKSALIMLSVIVLFDIIFPKEYMWEIFFLFKYAFAFVASTIYLAVRFKKDFYN